MSDSTTTSGNTGSMSSSSLGEPSRTSSSPARSGGGDVSASALQTERGTTSIAESVVSKITALAAREVDGVSSLGGSFSGALGGMMSRIRGQGEEHSTSGVGVEVGSTQAACDLTLQVEYPASIHEVADAVRQNVIDRIQSMTGLEVVEVNIAVVDLVFPGQERDDEQEREREQRQQEAQASRMTRVD